MLTSSLTFADSLSPQDMQSAWTARRVGGGQTKKPGLTAVAGPKAKSATVEPDAGLKIKKKRLKENAFNRWTQSKVPCATGARLPDRFSLVLPCFLRRCRTF